MAKQVLLCFTTLLVFSIASSCPKYTCDSNLGSNVCASYVQGADFKLNSNGCQSGYLCSSVSVRYWANLFDVDLEPGATYLCGTEASLTSTPTIGSSTWAFRSCGTKFASKNFKNGQTVISCNKDDECELEDGTNTNCKCVFKTDGTGICTAEISNDQVYAGYWEDCGSSNAISDIDTADYWVFYMEYWEYTHSTVECMNIFMETKMLSDLFEAYDGAETLTVGVMGLLALY